MARLTTLLLIATALGAVAALIGGCGGDEDGDGSLSKAEFVEQAEEACAEEKINVYAASNEFAEQSRRQGESLKELRARFFVEVQLPTIEAELAQLRELDLPEGDAGDLEAFLAAEQRAIDAAAAANDRPARMAARNRFEAAAKLADEYGIQACANPKSVLVGE